MSYIVMTKDGESHDYSSFANIFVNGEITLESGGSFAARILEMIPKHPGIIVIINSTGGNMRGLKTMCDSLHIAKNSKLKIVTLCIGYVASAAGILFLEGDERLMMPDAELMYHEVRSTSRCSMTLTQLKEEMSNGAKIDEENIEKIAEVTKLEKSKIKRKISSKDWTLSSSEAVEVNMATGVIVSIK